MLIRKSTYKIGAVSCKTNPILSASGGFKTLYLAKAYDNIRPFGRPKSKPKTNPNEPKQTQSPKTPKINPTSALTKGYVNEIPFARNQNKPKRTQFTAGA
jgi:hypothetical protein